jgi:hypothetical protein
LRRFAAHGERPNAVPIKAVDWAVDALGENPLKGAVIADPPTKVPKCQRAKGRKSLTCHPRSATFIFKP